MKLYINMNNGGGIETIDEFEDMKEAYSCCKEYRVAGYGNVWVSKRSTNDWRESHKDI